MSFFPNLFMKAKIPERLPEEWSVFLVDLRKSSGKEDCIKKAYDFLAQRYQGHRGRVLLRFFNLFFLDLEKIMRKNQTLHCHTLNYLLRTLLIKSGKFMEEDIIFRWSLIRYISPHQYLKIKLDNKTSINVDLWGKSYGKEFGEYSRGFK